MQRDLRGVHCVGHISQAGDGWILPDLLGLRCLYHGETASEYVYSSRAELVARAITPEGQTPSKDLEAVSRLAFTSYWLGESTGYLNVNVAPPGVVLRMTAGVPSFQRSVDILTLASSSPDASIDDLADQVIDDVAESLTAALERHGARHIIQLTGGKDSRLILAIAVRSGLAREFEYVTSGPDELADVQIASELCAMLDLRHEKRFLGQRDKVPFGESRRRFIRAVGGMVSGWETPGESIPGEVRVTGVCGELLRSFQKVEPDHADAEPTDRVFNRQRFGHLELLRPDLAASLYAEIVAGFSTAEPLVNSPLDRMHSYLAGSRMRYTRLGPQKECADEDELMPLYSHATIQAAMCLDPLDRQSDILILEVMRRCSPALVHHRFAGGGWDPRAQRRLEGVRPERQVAVTGREISSTASPKAVPGAAPSPPKAQSLMQSLYASPSDERTQFLAEVFSNPTNPIWSVLDRPVAVRALARWSDLKQTERRELFGAASAAVWADPLVDA